MMFRINVLNQVFKNPSIHEVITYKSVKTASINSGIVNKEDKEKK